MWDIRLVYHYSPRRQRLDLDDRLCIRPRLSVRNKPYLSTLPKTWLHEPLVPVSAPSGKHDQFIRVNPERYYFPSSHRSSVANRGPRRAPPAR
ncbi:hypothetical protein BDM02DRAFT_3121034 [Thelephora ganbajun]|uniref:Uncharacterized protein n=1 Tax=Thelephora ganbajun TaxID=370292 RepID=A0ACB6Z5Z3_THEGA|nr:hypothetical protein BDM02DRAFT_3121034 [Thelephora ganbajun]